MALIHQASTVPTDTNGSAIQRPPSGPARSLYVHVPFCHRRCGYCDFPLVAGRDEAIPEFLRAVASESRRFQFQLPVQTIYFGGGTPSHLSAAQWDELFAVIDACTSRDPDCEVSIEANPNDVDADLIGCLKTHGVTRVSLGIQSFQAGKLAALERTHSPEQARAAVCLLLESGFEVGIDLMFGLAAETAETWTSDVQTAIGLAPHHVSTYQLTIEKGTSFWSRRMHGQRLECDDDRGAQFYEIAIDLLPAAGFEHYEVSNFARPRRRCRHNEVYWSGEPFIGWGPGAASFCGGVRWKNHAGVLTYTRRLAAGDDPVEQVERLDAEAAARERLIFGLRRMEGIDIVPFQQQTGFDPLELGGEPMRRWIQTGLLTRDASHLRLSRSGLLISDSLWPDLV